MKQTMGEIISTRRKELGMTQRELADEMGVTDKAVSKWERNLSCPDINSLSKLADILSISIESLLSCVSKSEEPHSSLNEIFDNILKCVPLAMGVALIVSSMMGEMTLHAGLTMCGIGLFCLSLKNFINQ